MIDNISEVKSPINDTESIAVNELQPDNVGGQRSKFDVISAILYICLDGSLKNHVIGKGNFSDAMANHYLSILLYHNLLESYHDQSNNNRTYYKTTQKGRLMIQHYNNIQKLFAKENLAGYSKANIYSWKAKDNGTSNVNGNTTLRENSAVADTGGTNILGRFTSLTKKILIVDDESDITSALKTGLENYQDYTVDVNNDPISAISNFQSGAYDLIILDVRMPKTNGFELYKIFRKQDNKVKICFWTAFDVAYQELRKMFPLIDELYFIKKPITMEDLVRRIQKMTS